MRCTPMARMRDWRCYVRPEYHGCMARILGLRSEALPGLTDDAT